MVSQYTQAEKDEIYLDACVAFSTEVIKEEEFRATLAQLSYNATDIEDIVRQHRRSGDDYQGNSSEG